MPGRRLGHVRGDGQSNRRNCQFELDFVATEINGPGKYRDREEIAGSNGHSRQPGRTYPVLKILELTWRNGSRRQDGIVVP